MTTRDDPRTGLDHLIVGCADLAAGVQFFEQRLGQPLSPGGSHSGAGTRNALAGLGAGAYFELLAPDPDQADTPASLALSELNEPTLLHWAARCPAMQTLRAGASALGLDLPLLQPGRRALADGDTLRWTMQFLAPSEVDRAYPFFIDWQDSIPPGRRLPEGMALTDFTVSSPAATTVNALLVAADARPDVRMAPSAGLTATLQHGERSLTLTSSSLFPTGLHGLWRQPATTPLEHT
ncbi:MAG: VOC family protein [Pseudomonadota bacterium]